jgi:hypothetical protein
VQFLYILLANWLPDSGEIEVFITAIQAYDYEYETVGMMIARKTVHVQT